MADDLTEAGSTGRQWSDVDSDLEDLAQSVADQVASFLLAVREVAHRGEPSTAVPLLLL